jgi:hypothetical protein
MFPAIDEQHTVRRHPGAREGDQPFLHVEWQRRRPDIEAQLNGCRCFVHVLTARSGGANETLFNVAVVKDHGVRDLTFQDRNCLPAASKSRSPDRRQ